jgi:hypothetical protein
MKRILLAGLMIVAIVGSGQIDAQQTVGLLINGQGSYPGYTLFTARHYHTSYLINNDGRIINEWKQPDGLRVENCRLLENGQLIRAVNLGLSSFSKHPGAHGKMELVNWDGSISWSMVYGDETHILHHEIIPIKQNDGSYHFLASSWDKIPATDAVADGRDPNAVGGMNNYILAERLLEIEPVGSSGYNIVWEWNIMDHLVQEDYPSAGNYIEGGVATNPQLVDFNYFKVSRNPDWLHVNGLDYNAALDQIVISTPGFDEFFIVDHGTTSSEAAGHTGGTRGKGGDIIYRWGNHNAYDAGTTKFFDALHGAYWIPQGYPDAEKIMVLNNGKSSNESEIVIVAPNIDAVGNYIVPELGNAFEPLNYDWSYSNGSNFHTGNMGNGQRLPNGNTLINEAVKGRFFEIDTNDVIVWEYRCPTISTGPMEYDIDLSEIPTSNAAGDLENEVYKIIRYSTDYSGFNGLDMTPGDFVELNNPQTGFDQEMRDDNLLVYPNPTTGTITITGEMGNNTIQILTARGALYKALPNQSGPVDIDLSSLNSGLIFVKVTNNLNGSISVQKVIKK